MIGILIVESARGINEPVLEKSVPVFVDVLRMHQIDHLFRMAADQIAQFRIGFRGIDRISFHPR